MVNQRGKRFLTETTAKNPAYWANAVMRQDGSYAYMIFDQAALEHYMADGLDTEIVGENPVEGVDEIIDKIVTGRGEEILIQPDSINPPPMKMDGPPALFRANSIQELAQQTGIPEDTLTETVERYNHYCDTGRDRELYKDNRYLLPVRKPPFYCGKFHAFAHYSKVLNINGAGQVLTEDKRPIPGLYASGEFCFVIEGPAYPYAMAATCFMFGIAMSRIAARDIATHKNDHPKG
jgi:fumarate reductase flavoprotein subunit